MPYGYDYFGKKAWFDDQQAIVVQALDEGYRDLFRQNVRLDIEKEELEAKLRAKDAELRELQRIIDASIANLDPDSN